MMHGPCGEINPKCPCMKNQGCSKRFPKSFNDETIIDDQGFPVYRRRATGVRIFRKKGTVQLGNEWVVPYNLSLLKRFQAHINVEWCNKTNLLKYLFKYVMKGHDMARVRLQSAATISSNADPNRVQAGRNEIDEYIKCRFVFSLLFLLRSVLAVHSLTYYFLSFQISISL